jgi:hypothetical protein
VDNHEKSKQTTQLDNKKTREQPLTPQVSEPDIQKHIEMEEVPYTEPSAQKPSSTETLTLTSLAIVQYSEEGAKSAENTDKGEEEETEAILATPLNQALPQSSPKPHRQSDKIKKKLPIQYFTGAPVPAPHQNRLPLLRAGIDTLIGDFPYTQFTDEEIVDLFLKYGFSLDITDNIRIKTMQHFKSLSK